MDKHSDGESIRRMHPIEEESEVYNALEKSFSGAGDAAVNTAMEITTSGRQGGIEKLESVLDGMAQACNAPTSVKLVPACSLCATMSSV